MECCYKNTVTNLWVEDGVNAENRNEWPGTRINYSNGYCVIWKGWNTWKRI